LSRKKKERPRKHGLPPGTLVFTGHRHAEVPEVILVQYNEQTSLEKKAQETIPDPETEPEGLISWYDIRGLHHIPLIEQLGAQFNVHPLALEDVLDIQQRPKFEDYENAFFVTLQALSFDESSQEILTEQIAIYAGPGFVLSFQEKPDDTFQSVRNRFLHTNSRMRKRGVDYLVYSLMDVVVDHYYIVLDKLEEWIELQEREVLDNPGAMDKSQIHKLKLQVISLRKSILPLREAISAFARSDNTLVQDNTRIFVRDIYDHTIQIIDVLENWRDILNGLFELYLSQLSIRMNNVMQVLTIISTIFIPLTFIAGIYGMNFDNIPELHWKNGYFIIWGVMLFLALVLLAIFKRKKWL
jgi:magnesium transporter